MFAWMLVSKPCSEATDIGWLLSLGADFGNKNKKVNIGKGRDWGGFWGRGQKRLISVSQTAENRKIYFL